MDKNNDCKKYMVDDEGFICDFDGDMERSDKRIVLTGAEFEMLRRILRGSIDASVGDASADPDLAKTLEQVSEILEKMQPDMNWGYDERNLVAAILWNAREYFDGEDLIKKFMDALLLYEED